LLPGFYDYCNLELPYEGAKEMLLVSNVDDRALVARLIQAIYAELPEKKK